MKKKIKTIAVMTSGGDAPGMNAAIRAVVRTACNKKIKIVAIHDGYEGMINGKFSEMDAETVSNIIHKGGTIIRTSRTKRFEIYKWRKQAYDQLKRAGIEAVVLIGGNGSFAGALAFTSEFNIPFIGVPKTIDNDVYGTDFSIGFDTATNTALDAIDRIRDTANSHHRLFFVELMGRDLGFIALHCGIAGGAEAILVPENKTNVKDLVAKLDAGWKRNKSSLIVVVAEGAVKGGVKKISEIVRKKFDHFDIRISILGHIQRGGSPTCFDRLLASRTGNEAVKALLNGKRNCVVGIKKGSMVFTPFTESVSGKHKIDKGLLNMAAELSA